MITCTIKCFSKRFDWSDFKKAESDIDAKIRALGDVSSIALDKSSDVKAVRTSYDALTTDQKSFVTKLSTLTAAENKISELQAATDNEEVS